MKFMTSPAITGDRELVELFVRSLDNSFQDALNARLSIQDTLKIGTLGRSHMEDPYDCKSTPHIQLWSMY